MTDTTRDDIGLEGRNTSQPQPDKPAIEKYYILMIAIDHYPAAVYDDPVEKKKIVQGGFSALNNPVYDANGVLEILREYYNMGIPAVDEAKDLRVSDALERYTNHEKPIWVYDSLQVKCLYNEEANNENIRTHIADVFEAANHNDAFLIYFAGHGSESDDGYIIPYDAIKNKATTNWMPHPLIYTKFKNYLQAPKCRDMLVILDCCYSGNISFGQKGNEDKFDYYSRKALVSCNSDKLAADGIKWKGSPFANALISALKNNKSYRLALSDIWRQLDKEVKITYQVEQDILFDTLPVEQHGKGEFIFELKKEIQQSIPVELLAESIIDHLNFGRQKEEIATQYFETAAADFHVLTTSSYDFNVQQLLKSVLFQYMKSVDQEVRLSDSAPIIIWPELIMQANFWDAALNTLNKDLTNTSVKENPDDGLESVLSDAEKKALAKKEADKKEKVIRLLTDRLMSASGLSQPVVVWIGYDNSDPEFKNRITEFSKEVYTRLNQEKTARLKKADITFNKLFLIFSEINKGGATFIKREEIVEAVGPSCKVMVTTAIENKHISKGLFQVWINMSKPKIGAYQTLLEANHFFPEDTRKFEVFEFIKEVCLKMDIDRMEVSKKLGIFQP